jgi:hypothetical protein
MSQTAREPRTFLVPMRWLYAGNDPSRPDHRDQCPERPLIRSKRTPGCPLQALDLASVPTRRWHPDSVTSTLELCAGIKSP